MKRAAAKYVSQQLQRASRTAPPPASVETMLTWVLVIGLAHGCFITLSGRLKPQYNLVTRAYTGFNDFAWAAHYLTLSLVLWPLYDLVWRTLCIVLLPLDVLAVRGLLPLPSTEPLAGPESAGAASPPAMVTPPPALPDFLLSWVWSLRVAYQGFVADPWQYLPLTTPSAVDLLATPPQRDAEHNDGSFFWSTRTVTAATTTLFFGAICVDTYVRYTRRYIRGTLPEQNLRMRDFHSGDEVPLPLQYQPRIPAIPRLFWILLWSLSFVTAFAYVHALSVLNSELFPVCCIGLLLLGILMP